MANKERICSRCGNQHMCENHHILPKGLFGDGETDYLCPNCHADFHRKLGHKYLRKEHEQSMEFYFEKYFRWLAGLTIVGLVLFFIFQ